MKGIYIIIFSVLIAGQSFGQIQEKKVNLSLGVQPCLSSNIENIKEKKIAKLWKKFFKPYGKVKRNKKAKEYYSTGVTINRIKSGDPIDVYVKFIEAADGININMCFDKGTAFVSKDDMEAYNGASDVLNEFVIYVKESQLKDKLEDEEDKLDDMESDLKSARKKNKKLHASIEKYKQKIQKAEDDIEKNLQKQEDLKKNIKLQTEKVMEVQNKLKALKK